MEPDGLGEVTLPQKVFGNGLLVQKDLPTAVQELLFGMDLQMELPQILPIGILTSPTNLMVQMRIMLI